MVNRYTFEDDEVGMEIAEDGYWMAYADYEALEAKLSALVELDEWDNYAITRDNSAAPYWCALYKNEIMQGQGIGMNIEDAIRQALASAKVKP